MAATDEDSLKLEHFKYVIHGDSKAIKSALKLNKVTTLDEYFGVCADHNKINSIKWKPGRALSGLLEGDNTEDLDESLKEEFVIGPVLS